MLHVAVFELAVPLGKETALQPVMVVASAVKATLPVGALPVTVAVKVTLLSGLDGLAELTNVVVLPVWITCEIVVLFEPLLLPSPA